MSAGTYENDVQPISGAVFLDRILGWLSIGCGIPILGVAISRLVNPVTISLGDPEPSWVQMARVIAIVLGLVGIGAVMTSRTLGFRIGLTLHVARVVAVIAMYPWSGGPRFSGTELLWNLTVIGYCWLRLKNEAHKAQSNA